MSNGSGISSPEPFIAAASMKLEKEILFIVEAVIYYQQYMLCES
jgi:hypothetical protein